MAELETEVLTPTGKPALTAREKRDQQKAQLRPLANLRPELYEDEYTEDERSFVESWTVSHVVGSPMTVRAGLEELQQWAKKAA